MQRGGASEGGVAAVEAMGGLGQAGGTWVALTGVIAIAYVVGPEGLL